MESKKYKIGDIIQPRFNRHKNWERRIIVGYDEDGYLWSYLNNDKIFSSKNSSDVLLEYYWEKSRFDIVTN